MESYLLKHLAVLYYYNRPSSMIISVQRCGGAQKIRVDCLTEQLEFKTCFFSIYSYTAKCVDLPYTQISDTEIFLADVALRKLLDAEDWWTIGEYSNPVKQYLISLFLEIKKISPDDLVQRCYGDKEDCVWGCLHAVIKGWPLINIVNNNVYMLDQFYGPLIKTAPSIKSPIVICQTFLDDVKVWRLGDRSQLKVTMIYAVRQSTALSIIVDKMKTVVEMLQRDVDLLYGCDAVELAVETLFYAVYKEIPAYKFPLTAMIRYPELSFTWVSVCRLLCVEPKYALEGQFVAPNMLLADFDKNCAPSPLTAKWLKDNNFKASIDDICPEMPSAVLDFVCYSDTEPVLNETTAVKCPICLRSEIDEEDRLEMIVILHCGHYVCSNCKIVIVKCGLCLADINGNEKNMYIQR